MRWACAFILLLIPAGMAQTQVMEDPANDAATTALAGTQLPDGVVESGPFDLLGLFVTEQTDAFTFSVQVRDLAIGSGTVGTGTVQAQFQHADRIFRITWYRFDQFGTEYLGELAVYDSGRSGWSLVQRGPVQVDVAANTLHFTTARDTLVDGNGTLPQAGRQLTQFQAFSRGSSEPFFGFGLVRVTDTMPDQGSGLPYAVQQGLPQSGHARLSSDNPVRASNGEKATFVYHVRAANTDSREDRFHLATSGVPQGWDVTLPAATIRIEANSSRSFPVLVSVPFAHQHGAFEQFVLELTSQRDASSVGRLQIGIRYLAIPQPAGHHDTLHFHSRSLAPPPAFFAPFANEAVAYMNTLETDDADEGLPVPPSSSSGNFGTIDHRWDIYLDPGLQMGLDFDRNRTGTIEARFSSGFGIDSAQLQGQVLHLAGERAPDGSLRGVRTTVLADLVAAAPASVGSDSLLQAAVQPTWESDFVLYQKDAAMLLRLRLVGQSLVPGYTQETVPHLRGGHMQLPLNEYRDPVENVLNELAGLGFRHDSAAERMVNPGKTVLFNLTLHNHGAVDDTFTLRVNGTNAPWAQVLGDPRVFIPTGSQRPVVVAVRPPTDAPHGDIIDLIVTAASHAEPTVQGNIRVLAIVDTLREHPDEAGLVHDLDRSLRQEKRTPTPVVLLPLLLLLSARSLRAFHHSP